MRLLGPEIPFFLIVSVVLVLALAVRGVLVYQRQQHRYQLQRLALERGAPLPATGELPVWLLSLRKGVVLLVVGLLLIGFGLVSKNRWNNNPPPGMVGVGGTTQANEPAGPGSGMGARELSPPPLGPPEFGDGSERPGGGAGMGPMGRPNEGPMRGPRGGGGPLADRLGELRPPLMGPGSPAFEHWRRGQDERAVSWSLMGIGSILTLLGVVRIVFAMIEKRYAGTGS
ncbi:MAG: hypothetical protein WCI73_09840 [Phycisphaerae bacterium]